MFDYARHANFQHATQDFLARMEREIAMMHVRTDYWPKPIPTNAFDWSAVSDDYEPGHPIGYGATEAEAIADLVAEMEQRT